MSSFFEIVGIVVSIAVLIAVAFVLACLAHEVLRSIRQTCRLARAVYGKQWRRKMRPQVGGFIRSVWREMFSTYTTIRIGGLEFPYDPTKPIRRHRWYGA